MKGIDVSSFQGDIDWAQVVAAGYSFVIVKATQGVGITDPKFKVNIEGATAAGLQVGAYHFCSIGNNSDVASDAVLEANFFAKAIKSLPVLLTLPMVADVEVKSPSTTPAQVLLYINTFIKTLSTLGFTNVALYSSPSYLNENLPAGHNLGNIPLWIAEYGVSEPKIPNGWSRYWCWQNSQSGTVDGISGNVDTDVINVIEFQPINDPFVNPPPDDTPVIPTF